MSLLKSEKYERCYILNHIWVMKFSRSQRFSQNGLARKLNNEGLFGQQGPRFARIGVPLKFNKEGLFGIKNLEVCPNWVSNQQEISDSSWRGIHNCGFRRRTLNSRPPKLSNCHNPGKWTKICSDPKLLFQTPHFLFQLSVKIINWVEIYCVAFCSKSKFSVSTFVTAQLRQARRARFSGNM